MTPTVERTAERLTGALAIFAITVGVVTVASAILNIDLLGFVVGR